MIHDENAVSYGATWSPDGELILFTRWPMAGTFDLYTMEPDGNNLTQITETPDVDELYLDWARHPENSRRPKGPTEVRSRTRCPVPLAA